MYLWYLGEVIFYVESISISKGKTALCSSCFLNIHASFPSTTIFSKKIIGHHKFSLNKMHLGLMILAHAATYIHFLNIG